MPIFKDLPVADLNGKSRSSGNDNLQLILASASPRRQELLARFHGPAGFSVLVPTLDESGLLAELTRQALSASQLAELPHQAALALPAAKLQALAGQYPLPSQFVAVAADTLVVLDDQLLGKPASRHEAAQMLRSLAGRTHQVCTGVAVQVCLDQGQRQFAAVETTQVRFAPLTDEQIEWYLNTGEPFDKAGAYGIQGFGSALVEAIDGCYYNVMGLPVHRLFDLFSQAARAFPSNHLISGLLPW
jgi:septum formation protein